jgi:hypothetical protein
MRRAEFSIANVEICRRSRSWICCRLILSPRSLPGCYKKALSKTELGRCWDDLADKGEIAGRAIWELVSAAETAVPFMRDKAEIVLDEEAKRLAELIGELDDDSFKVRERASKALEKIGALARRPLEQAQRESPSEEVRQRAEKILKIVDFEPHPSDSRRVQRELRVIEVLERIGSRESIALLEQIKERGRFGVQQAEAKAALQRIVK